MKRVPRVMITLTVVFERQRSESLTEIALSVRMSEGLVECLQNEIWNEIKYIKKPKLTITQKIKVDTLYEQTPN